MSGCQDLAIWGKGGILERGGYGYKMITGVIVMTGLFSSSMVVVNSAYTCDNIT